MREYAPITEIEKTALAPGATDADWAAAFPVCARINSLGRGFDEVKMFLDWISYDEAGLILCDIKSGEDVFWPTHKRNRSIVYEYFELDEKAHDAELSRMVECLRILANPATVVEVPNDAR